MERPKQKQKRLQEVENILDKFIEPESGIYMSSECTKAVDDYYTGLIKDNYSDLLKPN
jgi:hypothetical protein